MEHTTAFHEGYKAHAKGVAFEDNPYNENPFMIFRSEWFKGWEASYDEEQLFNGDCNVMGA